MCAPRPHPSEASFGCGGRSGAGVPGSGRITTHPSTSPRRCDPDRSGGPRAPHPDPASSLPGPAFPPRLRTCSCSLRRGCHRRLRPRRFRPALRSLPPAPQADRPRRRWSAGPLPGSLLPSLHLAPEAATATGAVQRTPTPSPGYFPPPRSREKCAVASGSSRETHHHGSGCSKSSRC